MLGEVVVGAAKNGVVVLEPLESSEADTLRSGWMRCELASQVDADVGVGPLRSWISLTRPRSSRSDIPSTPRPTPVP